MTGNHAAPTAVHCDRHVGEPHPPRCGACDTLTAEYLQLGIPARYTPDSECPKHPGYPLPCDSCKRALFARLNEGNR